MTGERQNPRDQYVEWRPCVCKNDQLSPAALSANLPTRADETSCGVSMSQWAQSQRPISLFVGCLLVMVMLMLMVTSARTVGAQDAFPLIGPEPPRVPHGYHLFGFDLLHLLLKQRGLEPQSSLQDVVREGPDRAVVLIAGHSPLTWRNAQDLAQAGATVVVMADEPAILWQLGQIFAGPVTVPDSMAYQGHNDCFRVTNLNAEHPLTRDVKQLVVNRAGWLLRLDPRYGEWETVATLPDETNPLQSRNRPLIAAYTPAGHPQGKVLLLADHSMLSNSMLWHGDNVIFAMNLCDWLTAGGRDRYLFVEDGHLSTIKMPTPPLPAEAPPLPPPPSLKDLPQLPPEALLRFANHVIQEAEDNNLLNQAATTRLSGMSDAVYRRSLWLLVAAAVAFLILRQLFTSAAKPVSALPSRKMQHPSALRTRE